MDSPCPEVRELYHLRQKHRISRDLVAQITKISSTNLYRYERKGIVPIRIYRKKIADFVADVKELMEKEER